MCEDFVVDPPARSPEGGDGEAVGLGGPGDDRVGRPREAPHLLGLLLVVPAHYRSLTDVREGAAQGVQVLALVELPGEAPPVRLVGQVPGGVDRTPQRPVLLSRWIPTLRLPTPQGLGGGTAADLGQEPAPAAPTGQACPRRCAAGTPASPAPPSPPLESPMSGRSTTTPAAYDPAPRPPRPARPSSVQS